MEACQSGPPDIFARREREPTVDEDEDEDADEDEAGKHDALEYEAYTQVTFNRIPKTRYGLRVGRGDDAESPLPDELSTVSTYHFALTFDDH